ncbi:MAG: cell division protein FtsL [Desulfuromonadales bacterium]|jgi:cell division protein FtsL|nr:cell division protein FtsL [Desulfuromonadales bacterium]
MSETISRTVVKINGFSLDRPRLTPLFVVIALVSLLSLMFVWSRIEAINLEYDISSLQTQIRAGEEDVRRLRLEAAHLASDSRIEGLAREQLSLQLPAPGQVIRVN